MNLEMKIAKYIDLGITDYSKTFKLQEKLAEKRAKDEIPDMILISEHYPIINFGMREVHNTFSKKFIQELESKKIKFTEKNAISYIKEKGIDFSRTSRGGGATFIGLGQINFYPIVKYEKITQSVMGIDKYKEIIDSLMFSVLNDYGLNVKIHKDVRKEDKDAEKSIRKDIWIERNNKHFKLGGKGIHVSKGVAYHGFNFYLKKGSTENFSYVEPCGYTENELGVISIEEVLGNEVSVHDFKKRVLNKIKENFGYDSIKKIDNL